MIRRHPSFVTRWQGLLLVAALASEIAGKWPSSSSVLGFQPPPAVVKGVASSVHLSASTDKSTDKVALPTSASPALRSLVKVERSARLPVWPAWNGAFIWLVQKVLGNDVAAKLEDTITGRVGPQIFDYDRTSPFVLLVHHVHSFWLFDLLRHFQRQFILPEGFPGHPHRGFITLTYFLGDSSGGFVHRDSLGIRQTYGANRAKYDHFAQWLFTGAGILHEEMFDMGTLGSTFIPQRHELYQLWINVPDRYKMVNPTVQVLGPEECPQVEHESAVALAGRHSKTTVLAGAYNDQSASVRTFSPLCVYHVQLDTGGVWHCDLPGDYTTCLVYMRRGAVHDDATGEILAVHHTGYFDRTPSKLQTRIQLRSVDNAPADFLFLAGAPIAEPCVTAGSMVLSSNAEVNQAYMDYQDGKMGRPWSHQLGDDEWQRHVQQYPSQYRGDRLGDTAK